MRYEKPELHLLGPAVSLVLGSDNNGDFDRSPESDLRKGGDIEAGLDD
jgi:hypothetical protein